MTTKATNSTRRDAKTVSILEPEEAWQRIDPHLDPLPAESIPRRDCSGRVLAQGCAARVDVPAADVSAMDGFALAGSAMSTASMNTEPGGGQADLLPVSGLAAAGDPPGASLPPGSAMRIMTGAPLPLGADRVLPVEKTEVRRLADGSEQVRLLATAGAGDHIRRCGEVVRKGAPLLPEGTLLTAGALAVLATHGIGTVWVHRAPRVSLLVTGDEVVSPETTPAPGQLRDSHTDFLLAAVGSLAIRATPLGIAPDRIEVLRDMVRQGLSADVLLVTGGVSMGEFDFVEGVLSELGCEILFHRVAIQPGKPMVAARHPGGLVLGLPGNPASAMAVFWLFVRPVLRRLMGLHDGFWHGALAAELDAELPGAKGRDRFLPARIRIADGRVMATPLPPVGSHDLQAYGQGSALVRIPAGAAPAPAGTACEVLPFADWRCAAIDISTS